MKQTLGPQKGSNKVGGDIFNLTTEKVKYPVIRRMTKEDDKWVAAEEYDSLTMVVEDINVRPIEIRGNTSLAVEIQANTGADGQSKFGFLVNWYTRTILDRLANVEDLANQVITVKVGVLPNEKGEEWPYAAVFSGEGTIPPFFDKEGRAKMRTDPEKWMKFVNEKVKPKLEISTVEGPEDMVFETSDTQPEEGPDDLPF
jgi:hypothetical protein